MWFMTCMKEEKKICIMQYNSRAPQTTSSEMTKLNQHLFKTVSTRTEHYTIRKKKEKNSTGLHLLRLRAQS